MQPKSNQLGKSDLPNGPADRHRSTAQSVSSSLAKVEPTKPAKALVRKIGSHTALTKHNLARRQIGALMMAMIAIASLIFRRINYDLLSIMLLELALGIVLTAALAWLAVRGRQKAIAATIDTTSLWRTPLVCLLIVMPWIVDSLGRSLGGGNGLEIQLLGSLAWGALAAAIVARTSRSLSISVICSGFLTLFATFISDSGQATWFAYVWGILCLWWLVSNHWESIESQAATQIKTTGSYRVFSLLLGCLVFFVVTALISDRLPVLRKLKAELMPTSGGSSTKDSVGRGVGNGEALLAARNHPTSFGAVETDMFLESTKPSLFDVVSEEVGRPRLKRRFERAQALNSNDTNVKAGNFSEANRSSSGTDFSTQRHAPKTREKPDNLVSESILFWAGRSAAHLAVERFDSFDGVVWSKSATNRSGTATVTPQSIDMNGQTWLYTSEQVFPNDFSPFVDALPESLKFTRFKSPIVPTRCGLQMWCVDRLDRADFFAVDAAGLVSMPGREQVPEYTVVRMINSRIDRERLELLVARGEPEPIQLSLSDACLQQLDQLIEQWTKDIPRGFEQVEAVIDGLRRDFVYDRQWEPAEVPADNSPEDSSPEDSSPLQSFLESRRGPSYLFATAATQLLGRLGYQTRLVSGFYANSKHFISAEREIGILPQDAHVWLELHVGGDYWIPLEPTPGYQGEPLSAGWWYSIKRARQAIFQTALLIASAALLLFLAKGLILELISQAIWPLVALASDRSRVVWLARLLDLRSRLAGVPRRKSQALRTHLRTISSTLPGELSQTLEQYCQAADRLCFGGDRKLSVTDQQAIRRLWQQLTLSRIRQGQRAARQQPVAPIPRQANSYLQREHTHAIG